MYMFCVQRGLREAWGYFWTLWYSPKMWKLWARSTSPYLSRLRTTMNVENLWRQLKHGFLHNHLRPRLDQLIWILVTQVTPAYHARMQILNDGHRIGRSKAPTQFQKQFKTMWKKLEGRTLAVDADRKYITSVERWTCTCKSQPLNSCHLCKHLVDAVGHPSPEFWTQVVRRRTQPLYRHPALVPRGQEKSKYIEPSDGSITDGDDHALVDPGVLAGGGGWRDLNFSSSSLLGKRTRSSRQESHGDSSSDDAEEVQRQFFPAFDTHDSDVEEEVDGYRDHLLRRAAELEQAAAILRAQVPHRNKLWMSSIARRNIGADVGQMVADIRRFESTAHVRDTTWAKKGDKDDRRRKENTMGYQIYVPPVAVEEDVEV
ncbi:hypothetical protein B0H16DRAFT_1801158 [Mycena metata]|uniref:SWIM-type domain-containing protein n=1 Tax=Mycena metata TaxID=1033252 RepID=A0AAD7JJG0_9AGAR|nr:hypothetical protein B0H16DRAFT_1801158 [Mycena metata]